MLHEPELLVIDELSLGLAPAVVEQLLRAIEGLKARGQTMLVVEQSLNVAAALADRAVFMEKGRVRFEGPTRELLERDDLARAVFLGPAGDPSP
jgi:ABC-type branched-subunit amino acid transport system ATPase component